MCNHFNQLHWYMFLMVLSVVARGNSVVTIGQSPFTRGNDGTFPWRDTTLLDHNENLIQFPLLSWVSYLLIAWHRHIISYQHSFLNIKYQLMEPSWTTRLCLSSWTGHKLLANVIRITALWQLKVYVLGPNIEDIQFELQRNILTFFDIFSQVWITLSGQNVQNYLWPAKHERRYVRIDSHMAAVHR